MNMEEMEKYAEEHRRFEMPDFQGQFSLSYTEANKALEELEKRGIIKFCDGFTYETISDATGRMTDPVYVPKDAQEIFLIRALWECVKSRDASTSLIQRRLSCGYAVAAHAIDWMEENDFVGPYPDRKVKMSVEEYYAKFGNPDNEQEQSEDEERERYIEERRRALIERLSRMSDDDDSDEDDDEEDEQEDNTVDLRSVLIECLERGLQDKSDDEKFILGFDGEPKFQLKFVNDGRSLKISDGGKTFKQVSQTKRKINNVLKCFAPVKLEGEEIFIIIENPLGTLMALMTLYSAIDAVKKMK